MKRLCYECGKREFCEELCAEAERFVSQDYVSMTEIPASQLELDVNDVVDLPWSDVKELDEKDWDVLMELMNGGFTTKQERYLRMHYWDNISCRALGKIYGVSGQAVSAIIRRAKLKIEEKLR